MCIKHPYRGKIRKLALRKISKFPLIFRCGHFVERHSFRRLSGHLPETVPKLPFHKMSTPEK